MKKFGLLFSIIISISQLALGQTTGDYRSKQSGNWDNLLTWETYVSPNWVAPASVPSNASGVITIQSPHVIAIASSNVTIDQMIINSGGQVTIGLARTITIADGADTDLTVNGLLVNAGTITRNGSIIFGSGSTYQHQKNGGIIPTATWDTNSTCLITGITDDIPSGMGQTFGHLTWNCPGQTTTTTIANRFTVSGNFTLTSTGSGGLQLDQGSTIITGNYSQTGGLIRLASANTTSLNVGGSFTLSGGTFRMSYGSATGTLNIAGNFSHASGTIDEDASGSGSIIFNGTGNQTFTSGGIISGAINFTINNSAGITLLSSATFPATLTMTSGNIALNGNTLTLGTSSTNTGNLSWTNGFIVGSGSYTRWFSTSAITLGNVLGLFPMGNGTDNRNVWIGGTPTTGGTVTVQHSHQTGTTVLSFIENSQTFDKKTNMSWTLSNANGFAGSSMSLRIQGSGILGITAVGDLNICLASTAAGGTYTAPGGSITDPIVNRTGLTQATLANTFYFASTSGSPLPVELSSFSATINGSSVKLSWRTNTEVNNYGFEVERCVLSAERQAWETIGFVSGNGNSNSPKSYSFIDDNVNAGTYCYRLKQIDNDGQSEYSKVVEVSFIKQTDFSLEQNFPNPFNPNTSIKFSLPETGNVKLTIYNLLGQEIATLVNGVKEAGTHTINYNAEELNSGIYIYKLEADSFVQTKKMTLIK